MNTIFFGKAIKTLLNTTEINTKIGLNKVYPLVNSDASESITYPFLVYQRYASNKENDKEKTRLDYLSYEIVVASDGYDNSLEVADMVINALDNKRGLVVEGFTVKKISLKNSSEKAQYVANKLVYFQNLMFDIIINIQ